MNNFNENTFNNNPKYSTTLAFILGLILTNNLSAPEQNALGNWILLLGQTIVTNGSIHYSRDNKNINDIKSIINNTYPNNKEELNYILNYIKRLEKTINEIKK